jgi:hypothetical protein
MIGGDPAKHSHTMAVLDGAGRQLAALQVANDNDGYQGMLRLARRWPQRTWAVEGEDTWGRLQNPARLTDPRWPALRTSHFPDPPRPTLRPGASLQQPPLDTEGSRSAR